MEQCSDTPPHVLIFPAPGQGHLNAMLKLAELLALAGLKITFQNFEYIHDNLVRCTDVEARFAKYHGFQFKTIPNCWPADGLARISASTVKVLLEGTKSKSKPIFKKMLIDLNNVMPINCIIGDMVMGFVYDVATEVGVPAIQFHTISACSVLTFFSIPDIVAAHELPVEEVPGMETFLGRRDLPNFCQKSSNPYLLMLTEEMRQSQALIFNTFEDLEAATLSHIRIHYPKIYTVGPLHVLLKSKLARISKQEFYSTSNSILEMDRSCMKWLDEQPLQSVLYVSFGSTTVMTIYQFMEFWHGIVKSKQRFLWVIMPETITNKDGEVLEKIPADLKVGSKENRHIVRCEE